MTQPERNVVDLAAIDESDSEARLRTLHLFAGALALNPAIDAPHLIKTLLRFAAMNGISASTRKEVLETVALMETVIELREEIAKAPQPDDPGDAG